LVEFFYIGILLNFAIPHFKIYVSITDFAAGQYHQILMTTLGGEIIRTNNTFKMWNY
jgi:hypothetical protein